ncbi:hypothetical protein DFH06DRAFT_1133734 [Mycena polygramma]|nr:hypothetical protein DFH06DRAFT_1133734 [Mycena polygramma]
MDGQESTPFPTSSPAFDTAQSIRLPSPTGTSFRFGSQASTSVQAVADGAGGKDLGLGPSTPSSFSSHIPEDDDDDPAIGNDTEILLPPLQSYNRGYVVPMDPEDPPTWQMIDLPTLHSLRKIRRNHYVRTRREECISKGIMGLLKPSLRDMQVATRRLQRDIFPRELDALDSLLTQVQTNRIYDDSMDPAETRTAYRLSPSHYHQLIAFLYFMRGMAVEAFGMMGRDVPAFPYFGSTGQVQIWHNENDFEILCVCFRLEVEHFLWDCDQIYDYQRQLPRSVLRIAEGQLQGQLQGPPKFKPDTQSQHSKVMSPPASPVFKRDIPPHMDVDAGPTASPPAGRTSEIEKIVSQQVQQDRRPGHSTPFNEHSPVAHSTPVIQNLHGTQPRVSWGGIPDIRRTHAAAMMNPGYAHQYSSVSSGRRVYQPPANTRRLNELLSPVARQIDSQVPNVSVNHGHAGHPDEIERLRRAAGVPFPPLNPDPNRASTSSPNNPFRNRAWTQPQPQVTNPPPYSSGPRLPLPAQPLANNIAAAASNVNYPSSHAEQNAGGNGGGDSSGSSSSHGFPSRGPNPPPSGGGGPGWRQWWKSWGRRKRP